jgi:hypothetical protein
VTIHCSGGFANGIWGYSELQELRMGWCMSGGGDTVVGGSGWDMVVDIIESGNILVRASFSLE